jgi:hypothetical protein
LDSFLICQKLVHIRERYPMVQPLPSLASRTLAGILLLLAFACGNSKEETPVQPPPPMPAILSFTAAQTSLLEGSATTLTAVFLNGTGSIDHGLGPVTSGVAIATGNLDASTTYTLTVTNAIGRSATAQVTVTAAPLPRIQFTTEGAQFAPVLVLRDPAEVLWTWADGSTSSSLTPTKDYGSAASRNCTLLVTPWSALQRINLGYDAGDGGSGSIEMVPDQQVSAVQGLELVAPTLGQWCSSYNQLTALDFSHFVQLDTIECYLSQTLASVNLADTPALKRACFEDCNLSALDLSQSPALEDLRGAVNAYTTIQFGTVGAQTWHICVRDNPQMTTPNLFADLTQFPRISELFIWNDNQSGTLRIPASHPTMGVSLQGDGNHYSTLDLHGALQNPGSSAAVSFRNNQLSSVNLTGCTQITELFLENNQLSADAADSILATLDGLGRDRASSGPWASLMINLSGNAAPSSTGYDHAVSLAAKGWTITATGWTLTPTPPPDTGAARIDFSTEGDATSLRCDFVGTPTATWHWSDGSTSAAVSGSAVVKSGLGAGNHAHYLTISNGSALSRFGAADGNQGHLIAISGLNNAPLLSVLSVYAEPGLVSIDRVNASRIQEFHLMGTALSTAAMDQVFADAVASNVLNGIIWCPNLGTSASDADRATLVSRGWTLNQ